MATRHKMVDVGPYEIKVETDAAILIDAEGDDVWLPKSQIDYNGDPGDFIEIEMPAWLAEAKGLA